MVIFYDYGADINEVHGGREMKMKLFVFVALVFLFPELMYCQVGLNEEEVPLNSVYKGGFFIQSYGYGVYSIQAVNNLAGANHKNLGLFLAEFRRTHLPVTSISFQSLGRGESTICWVFTDYPAQQK